MEPVNVVTGTAVPLDRSDVDTDQIIPSDWLKQVERTGFGEGLFSEWRDDRDFVLNLPQFDGANDPRRRPELRHRFVTRARGVGDHGLRLRGRDLAALRRHLPQQLHEERPRPGAGVRRDRRGAAAGGRGRPDARDHHRRRDAGWCRHRRSASRGRSRSTTRRATASCTGLDDIGITLGNDADRRLEASAPPTRPRRH